MRVNLMFGDMPSKYQVFPFGDNNDSVTTVQGPKEEQQPKEPITSGNALVTTVTRTIWKMAILYMTKLPIITFEGPNNWTFEGGKPYDFDAYNRVDILKVMLPSHWSKNDKDYNPPIYDSEPENKTTPRPKC